MYILTLGHNRWNRQLFKKRSSSKLRSSTDLSSKLGSSIDPSSKCMHSIWLHYKCSLTTLLTGNSEWWIVTRLIICTNAILNSWEGVLNSDQGKVSKSKLMSCNSSLRRDLLLRLCATYLRGAEPADLFSGLLYPSCSQNPVEGETHHGRSGSSIEKAFWKHAIQTKTLNVME